VPHRTDPARPSARTTADGRPLAEVRSYARRGSRLTPAQEGAWERRAGEWLLPPTVVTDGLPAGGLSGRGAPLVVEIGSGDGEVVTSLAARRPTYDVLVLEVWRPGLASTFLRLEQAGVGNVRALALDAVWVLEHLLAEGSVAELWTFFPDPWPKARHHKRRLVTPEFAALAASRLAPGGSWRLATDWPDYAERMVEVLDAEPRLRGGVVERWDERPVTRFERRGLAAGRPVTDLHYRRVADPALVVT
jgi:tRNA (guanine-N7-)-methyltransferase